MAYTTAHRGLTTRSWLVKHRAVVPDPPNRSVMSSKLDNVLVRVVGGPLWCHGSVVLNRPYSSRDVPSVIGT